MPCKLSNQQCSVDMDVKREFCKYHARKTHRFRIKQPQVLGYEKHVQRMEQARLRKVKSRLMRKNAIKALSATATETARIALVMSKLKERKTQFVLVSKVLQNFNVKTLRLARTVDPITFTDETAPVTRTMAAILNPVACFHNVLSAMNQVFPGCTHFKYKLIKSLANDPPQLLHTDFDTHLIFKKIINLDSFHYSAIIALQPHAHLFVGKERVRVDIPVGDMIVFRGDMPHAGGGYEIPNARIFISLSSDTYPLSNAVYLVKLSKVK
jgi:hypothetical protein